VFTLGIALVFYWLKSLATTFEIASQRVRIERGILSKVKDSIELFRIDHFDLHKPLGMRLAGYCLLHLRSSDASFETVILYGIPNLEQLADTLRERDEKLQEMYDHYPFLKERMNEVVGNSPAGSSRCSRLPVA